jgi:hypothetical protein
VTLVAAVAGTVPPARAAGSWKSPANAKFDYQLGADRQGKRSV